MAGVRPKIMNYNMLSRVLGCASVTIPMIIVNRSETKANSRDSD
jgi:hypothetical protein